MITLKTKLVYTMAILFVIAFFSIPFILTNDKSPFSINVLSLYGSYISGIASVLNLFVFIYLSILIARQETIKSEIEIKVQKTIVQTQFRQAELEKLVVELDRPFDTNQESSAEKSILRYTRASIFLNNFLNQKQYLFPLLREEQNMIMGYAITESFVEMIITLDLEDKIKQQEIVETLFGKIQEQKSDFIHLLQVFILDDLN
jgi:hypothetical protein